MALPAPFLQIKHPHDFLYMLNSVYKLFHLTNELVSWQTFRCRPQVFFQMYLYSLGLLGYASVPFASRKILKTRSRMRYQSPGFFHMGWQSHASKFKTDVASRYSTPAHKKNPVTVSCCGWRMTTVNICKFTKRFGSAY